MNRQLPPADTDDPSLPLPSVGSYLRAPSTSFVVPLAMMIMKRRMLLMLTRCNLLLPGELDQRVVKLSLI